MRPVTSRELEQGAAGLHGELGDGQGLWRLLLSAEPEVLVMSLLENSTGYLSNVSGGGHAEPLRRSDADGDGVSDHDDAFPNDPTRQQPIDGISTTLHDQIVVELRDEDSAPPSLFDLNGKTVLFQRLGETGYARSVAPLAWESDIGSEVGDEAVRFRSFAFPFAQSIRDAFHVNVNGNITLGEPLGRPLREQRFAELSRLGSTFAKGFPTIAAFYKPHLSGKRFVNWLGVLNSPIYMNSNQGRGFGPLGASSDFNFALSQLGHEMAHSWTVGKRLADPTFLSLSQRGCMTPFV